MELPRELENVYNFVIRLTYYGDSLLQKSLKGVPKKERKESHETHVETRKRNFHKLAPWLEEGALDKEIADGANPYMDKIAEIEKAIRRKYTVAPSKGQTMVDSGTMQLQNEIEEKRQRAELANNPYMPLPERMEENAEGMQEVCQPGKDCPKDHKIEGESQSHPHPSLALIRWLQA